MYSKTVARFSRFNLIWSPNSNSNLDFRWNEYIEYCLFTFFTALSSQTGEKYAMDASDDDADDDWAQSGCNML